MLPIILSPCDVVNNDIAFPAKEHEIFKATMGLQKYIFNMFQTLALQLNVLAPHHHKRMRKSDGALLKILFMGKSDIIRIRCKLKV